MSASKHKQSVSLHPSTPFRFNVLEVRRSLWVHYTLGIIRRCDKCSHSCTSVWFLSNVSGNEPGNKHRLVSSNDRGQTFASQELIISVNDVVQSFIFVSYVLMLFQIRLSVFVSDSRSQGERHLSSQENE